MNLLLLAWLALGVQQAPPCETLAPALKGRACVAAGERGAAVAADEARARRLAELSGAADMGFRERFGAEPAGYVVFESGTPPEVSRDRAAFQRAGFAVVLPWASGPAFVAEQRRNVASGIRTQMSAFGAGEEQILGAVANAHAQIEARNTPEALEARDVSGLPYGLTRRWVVEAFWPNGAATPAWLVEAAAQSAEPETAAQARRDLFRDIWSGQAPGPLAAVPADDLLDVRALMAGQGAPPRAGAASPGGGGRVMVIGGGPDMPAPTFAPTVRVFADYLTARAGSDTPIRSLAQALSGGATFETWLPEHGAAHRLPVTMEGLEVDWRGWVTETYGQPAD